MGRLGRGGVHGEHGMRALLLALGRIDMALVCEPTGMQAAAGERGLVVLDCTAHGKSGHAARGEESTPLHRPGRHAACVRSARAESELLGPVGIAVTQIEAGTQHNVVPDTCRFVADIRTTDAYTNEETVEEILRAASHPVGTRRYPGSDAHPASALGAEHHP